MEGMIIIIAISIFIWSISKDIYNMFDHSGWNEKSTPDINATIVSMESEEVKLAKNDVKFKTTIVFSDGFFFITHKTNREEGFLSYKISIDRNLKKEIIDKAIKKHEKAIEKIRKEEQNQMQ